MVDVIGSLRPGAASALKVAGAEASFGPEGLDLDLLERFTLATAVAEALQLSRIDRLHEMDRLADWVVEAQRRLRPGADVGFRTSGSTGRPKVVIQEFEALAQEIVSLGALFGDRKRIISLVPAHHIYGFLFTVLLPMHLDAEVVDARPLAPPTVRALAGPGDLVVATPSYWRLFHGGRWPDLVDGVTSGAACPQDVAKDLCVNGLRRLVEVYGSTETGGIGWRDAPTLPFRLFPHLARDDEQNLLKTVGGAVHRIALPDHVTWHGLDLLTPRARRDGAVQVGGVNVYPHVTRSVLLAHPGVADADVRLMREDEGERLKAFVVAKDAAAPLEPLRLDLEAWLSERLQPLERPRAFTFGPAIPANAMGKKIDW